MKFTENDTTITVENNKGDFAFTFNMQKGSSWAQAKQSANEIYEQIVRMEFEALVANAQKKAEEEKNAKPTEVESEVM